MAEETIVQTKKSGVLYLFVISGIILFIGGALLSGFVIKKEPQIFGLSAQSELTGLISQVEKLIVLPADELPTASTIGDVSTLSGQSFFKNAKTGDKLLAYPNAKWAVLYRPTENKIVEVGAFEGNVQTTTPVPTTATPTAVPTATSTPVPSESPSPSPSIIPSTTPAT